MAIGSAASLEAAAMNKLRWRHVAVPAALMCGAGALVVGSAPVALATAGQAVSRAVAGPGTNLLLNPGAQAGGVSAQGWDAVTIPGWRVASGLPTVVRYGTPRFPRAAGRWPAVRGGHLFAGGAGGTARLRQQVPLRPAAGHALPAGTRYRLSAWLGGTTRSRAAVRVTFLSAAGRVLGAARDRLARPELAEGRARQPDGGGPAAAGDGQRPGHAGPGHLADRHRRAGRAARGL